jgi:hypothetical protein
VVKEQAAREHVFSLPGNNLTFLDVGARDSRLTYLLGIRRNLEVDEEMHVHCNNRSQAGMSPSLSSLREATTAASPTLLISASTLR